MRIFEVTFEVEVNDDDGFDARKIHDTVRAALDTVPTKPYIDFTDPDVSEQED